MSVAPPPHIHTHIDTNTQLTHTQHQIKTVKDALLQRIIEEKNKNRMYRIQNSTCR